MDMLLCNDYKSRARTMRWPKHEMIGEGEKMLNSKGRLYDKPFAIEKLFRVQKSYI